MSIISRVIPKRFILKHNYFNVLQKRKIQKFQFEIPAKYQKTFYLANATLHENVNWFYYNGIEVAFNKFVEKIKYACPTLSAETVANIVHNRVNSLDCCSYVLEINFPLVRNSGKLEFIQGYCVKHGVHYPIYLGGLSLCESIEKSHLKAFAALNSFKNACVDIPFAGAQSGLKINPEEYSPNELKQIIYNFTNAIADKNFLGFKSYILEPGCNCTPNITNYLIDEYQKHTGNSMRNIACITGKPTENGGFENYDHALANAIYFGVDNILHNEEILCTIGCSPGWSDKTYIIKGLGKLGIQLISLFSQEGAKCVGICENNGGFYNKKGINTNEAIEYKRKHGHVLNFFPLNLSKDKIISKKCDLLIFASSHQSLTCYSAPNVNCKIAIEAVNGAITPTAHKILLSKNVLTLPDIFINTGSLIASYLEYVKNVERNSNDAESKLVRNLEDSELNQAISDAKYFSDITRNNSEVVREVLLSKMNTCTKKLMNNLGTYNLGIDIRTAAYILAAEKIFELLENNRYL